MSLVAGASSGSEASDRGRGGPSPHAGVSGRPRAIDETVWAVAPDPPNSFGARVQQEFDMSSEASLHRSGHPNPCCLQMRSHSRRLVQLIGSDRFFSCCSRNGLVHRELDEIISYVGWQSWQRR